MTKAVFLDRDGTINKEVDVLRHIRQLSILPGAGRAIAKLNQLDFLVIVVSNQAVVARGWLTEKGVENINTVLHARLKKFGASIDAFYFCPHHPNADVKTYRKLCKCRKPNTGMFKKAQKKFGIDMKKSFMVGDNTKDILAGRRAGLTTILVRTGYGGKDGTHVVTPDFIVKNLSEAVMIIARHAK